MENLAIIDCVKTGDGDTCTLSDRYLVITEDQEILANCTTREIAEMLRAAIANKR